MRNMLFLLLFLPVGLWAQVSDDFSDGDFTHDPAWSGMDTCFKVNTAGQLQSAATAAGSAFLSVPIEGGGNREWCFWIRENFSPSGNNYADVWLVADSADLRQASSGYFLRFGAPGNNDAVELYQKSGMTLTLVCRGADGAIASPFRTSVKVVCDSLGNWTLSTDPEALGSYAVEAEGHAGPCPEQGFFGFLITYTASNAKKFYFDDIYVGPEVIDTVPPHWIQLEVRDASQLQLTFDEPLSESALEQSHFMVVISGLPDSVGFASRPSEVSLFFVPPLPENVMLQLHVSGLSDLAGNVMVDTVWEFAVYKASANDVVINEIMADPSPPQGLPEYEYIELYNTTGFPVELSGWKLVVGNSEKAFPVSSITPEGYLLLCKDDAAVALSGFGPVCGFSSFTIANAGALIQLYDPGGTLVSELSFSDTWYRDAEKKEGGWSLEQIDPLHPCAGARNWMASDDVSGGTPGRENSVFASNTLAPQVERVSMLGDDIVLLWFDQQMDRQTLAVPEHYRVLERDVSPVEVLCNPINAASVELVFGAPFQEGMSYTLLVEDVANCSGDLIDPDTRVAFGIPYPIGVAEILINEIMFNPIEPGMDYVELYNPTDKPFDLSELKLGVIKESFPNPADTVLKVISEESCLFMPHSYLLLSTDGLGIARQYECHPESLVDMASFPSYPNSGGFALLVSRQGVVVDQMAFDESMHHPLLKETKGVALERVSWWAPSDQADNWHSAAEAVHFGTPGYHNSMAVDEMPWDSSASAAPIQLDPEVFSPDGDGFGDLLTIHYVLEQGGCTMNTYIFDADGRLVRHLVRGELVAKEGCFVWNGLDQRGGSVPLGIYVLVTEVFDGSGGVKRYRNVVAVASR